MSLINIGGDRQDKSYRYKMPPLTTKIEGSGNGIKTVLTNMCDVAKALHTEPIYPIKFFAIELGTQCAFDASNERAVINGTHTAADQQKILEKFIQQFVQCPICKFPEQNIAVSKSGRIKMDCDACGHNGVQQSSHKQATFIINHPPPKIRRSTYKGNKQEQLNESFDDQQGNESVVNTKYNANDQNRREKKEIQWYSDTSEEAARQRKQAEFGDLNKDKEKQQQITDILNMAKAAGILDAPSTSLKLFVVSKDRSTDEIYSELRRLQIARGLDEPQKIKIIFQVFIDPTSVKDIEKQFTKQADLLKRFTREDQSDAIQFIACLEDYVGDVHTHLLPRIPLIIKEQYECDVLTEEDIIAWYSLSPDSSETNWLVRSEIAKATRARCAPQIEWLQNDEEEDEDSNKDQIQQTLLNQWYKIGW